MADKREQVGNACVVQRQAEHVVECAPRGTLLPNIFSVKKLLVPNAPRNQYHTAVVSTESKVGGHVKAKLDTSSGSGR